MANWWDTHPFRTIQTNFREIDTADFDEDRFIEDLKAFSCNTVMLNAAGLIASYPTDLEDHVRSAYIENFDLKHLVDRCHENGIRVIARTDFSKIPVSVFEKHPDWAYRKPDGEPLIYNGYVQTCMLGGYQSAYMDEIIREMLTKIPFDGVYCNMGTATGYIVDYSMTRYGPCQCELCQTAFKKMGGSRVPEALRPGDPDSLLYFRFVQEVSGAQKKRITSLVKEINPDAAYCSVDYVRQEANAEMGRELPHWQYQSASNARAIRGMGVNGTSCDVDFLGFFNRHVSTDTAHQELRLWQSLSNFAGLDYYVMGRLDNQADKSAQEAVKKVFAYAAAHEKEVYGMTSAADVLLVRDSYIIPSPEERGWIRTLTEAHILFDETLSGGLSRKDLSRYRAVILPEKMRLAPPVQEKLDAYAEAGGIVLGSGAMPALKCFGTVGKPVKNTQAMGASLCIREEDQEAFPDMKDRAYVIVGNIYYEYAYEENCTRYGVYLKPERFGPPELCYATEAPTDFPAAVKHPFGKGFGVVIPWNPAANYYQNGFENWFLFMKDVLEQLCGCVSVGKNVSPMVEVTYGKKEDLSIVHFVNGSGHFGNSFFAPATLSDQTVCLPWDGQPVTAENLDEPGNVKITYEDGCLLITVPKLSAHAGIAIRKQKEGQGE